MQSISTFLPKMPAQQVRAPAPRGPQSTMLTVMTDLPPLNGPPAPRGPPRPMLNGPPLAQRPMLAVTTDLPPLNGPPAPRAQRPRPMLAVMTDLSPLNGPPAPRASRPRPMLNGPPAPRAQRPMLAVTTDHPYVPEVVWIPRHALLQYPNRKKCIAKSK